MERPIIINETDVSKCPAFRIDGFCAATGINTKNYCEDSPQCFYKELQREKTNNQSLRNEVEAIQHKLEAKTAECERLRKELLSQEKIINRLIKLKDIATEALENSLQIFDKLDNIGAYEEVRQALERIEE